MFAGAAQSLAGGAPSCTRNQTNQSIDDRRRLPDGAAANQAVAKVEAEHGKINYGVCV